jgi:hypothetical protein
VRLFDVADDESEKVVSAGLVRETDSDDDDGHEKGQEGGNNGDQSSVDTGETAAIAPNANDEQDIGSGQDTVDARSDADNAPNQADNEDNQ